MTIFYIDTTSSYLYTAIIKDNDLLIENKKDLGKNLSVVEKQYEANVIYYVASNNVDMIKNIQEKLAKEVKIEHLGSRFLEKID